MITYFIISKTNPTAILTIT